MSRENKLFVYGTLLRDCGHAIHQTLKDELEYLGEAVFNGILFNLGAYPGVVACDDPEKRVKGELYRLREPELILNYLDAYEGCNMPSPLYMRSLQSVRAANGENHHAWIYLYSREPDGYEIIESGDYLHYLRALKL